MILKTGQRLETRAVRAGAYLGGALERASGGRTHAVIVDSEGVEIGVVCGKVYLDSLADTFAGELGVPTCAICRKRIGR